MEVLADGKATADVSRAPGDLRFRVSASCCASARLGLLAIPFWHAPALCTGGRRVRRSRSSPAPVAIWRNRSAFLVFALAGPGGADHRRRRQPARRAARHPQLIAVLAMPASLLLSTVFLHLAVFQLRRLLLPRAMQRNPPTRRKPAMSNTSRVALVTGAGSGIGRACALVPTPLATTSCWPAGGWMRSSRPSRQAGTGSAAQLLAVPTGNGRPGLGEGAVRQDREETFRAASTCFQQRRYGRPRCRWKS